ncbi:Er membrane protein complex subunit 2 [Globisporangium polare]
MTSNTGSSKKTQWSAMDLHVGSGARFQQPQTVRSNSSSGSVTPGTGGASAMRLDDSGLSARNILIRRKLMERKRFDSADYAMKQNQEGVVTTEAMSDTSGSVSSYTATNRATGDKQARYAASQQKYYTNTQANNSRAISSGGTPAQVGASVFFTALGGDENVDMDTKLNPSMASTGHNEPSTLTKSYATQNASTSATAAAAARSASRYGNLPGPAGGAQSARNILIQKKLREKKHFDSADYQLAQMKTTTPPSSTDGNSSVAGEEENNTATPMEIDLTPVAEPAVESINSPSAASIAHRNRVNAQMSPSVRGGKYGGGLSGANVLLMRKLSAKKQFDSADYYMEAAPVSAKARQNFFVAAPAPPTTSNSSTSAVAAPPAPQAAVSSSAGGNGGSKYGKLSAVNVLIRKKLKERKRFDSADYVMEKQGRRQPPNGDQGGSSGTLQGGHVVMGTPMTHNVNMNTPSESYATAAEDNKSISHQVKHIKLSEEGGGWATRVPASSGSASSSSSSASFSSAMPKHGPSNSNSSSTMMSGDSRLVARNLIIQRKLSERKRFDSADYFKDASNRGQS